MTNSKPAARRLALLAGVLTATLGLSLFSCSNVLMSFTDKAVQFDSSGHFKTTTTYTIDGGTTLQKITYSSNGDYANVTESYNTTTSSWTESNGLKGTYSYDTKTMTTTYNNTQVWDPTTSAYRNLTSSDTTVRKTETINEAFGSRLTYLAYTGSSGTYTLTVNATDWGGASESYTDTYNVNSSLSTVTETATDESDDSSGSVTSATKNVYTDTVSSVFPSGVASLSDAKGKAITLSSTKQVDDSYTWSGSAFSATPTTTVSNTAIALSLNVASNLESITMQGAKRPELILEHGML